MGSPPHTWRILKHIIVSASLLGITSTHVENTLAGAGVALDAGDHLHTRGEY